MIESAEVKAAQEPIEKQLWLAVVALAVKDLRSKDDSLREYAMMFLYSQQPAYRQWREQVFQMAGLV